MKSILKIFVSTIIVLTILNSFESKISLPNSTLNDSLSCFLVISDIHLKHGENQNSAGEDSGDSLWKKAEDRITNLIAQKNPRFLLVLGDLPFHADCHTPASMDSARKSFDVVYHDLISLAKRGKVPLIMVPGNNDSWGGDYRKFDLPDSFFATLKYPLADFSDAGKSSIISNTYLKNGGFYSLYPLGKESGLRIIVLNTTMFVKDSNCEYRGNRDSDISAQIAWFNGQLNEARNLKEHVLIVMHVPPGIDGYETFSDTKNNPTHKLVYIWNYLNYQDTFLNLIHDYQANIIGILASHTHMDGIRLLENRKEDSITCLLISVPGIAPGHGNNPAIKLIEYNPKTFALQNFITYYMNYWNECNNRKNSNCNEKLTAWNDYFNFRNYLNCPDTLSLLECFQKLQGKNKQKGIKEIVNKIFSVNGKLQDSNAVNATIYVDY